MPVNKAFLAILLPLVLIAHFPTVAHARAKLQFSQQTADLDAKAREKISQRVRDRQYEFHKEPGGRNCYGRNPDHNLFFRFDEDRLAINSIPQTDINWSMTFALAGWGVPERLYPGGKGKVEAKGNRLDIRRDGLTEWYLNSRQGLEQGFTVTSPPDGVSRWLAIELAGRSSFWPELLNERELRFIDKKGKELYRYSGLLAWDATGRDLPARMVLSDSKGPSFTLRLLVDVRSAVYPVTVDPTIVEVKKLVASDAAAYDYFGESVSISGDAVVIGAAHEDSGGEDAGAAYVFQRNQGGGDNWGEVKKLVASDVDPSDYNPEGNFGISVSIGGDTVVIGAAREDSGGDNAGAAYVFQRNQGGANSWGEVKKLVASDSAAFDFLGWSVSISGDTVVIGAVRKNSSNTEAAGAAYVFQRNQGGANNWGEVKKLVASNAAAYDYFGESVSISGDAVVVGAAREDSGGDDAGAAYVFQRNQGGANNWGEVKKLVASDAAAYDYFGESISISGDTIIIGAANGDSGGDGAGAAYVFQRNQGGANNWGEVKKLVASDAAAGDYFGESVSISGDTVVVGAWLADSGGANAGAAYVFQRHQGNADNWGEVKKLVVSDAAAGDYFGESVSISGDTVVVGAAREDGGGDNAGAAYVFQWTQGYVAPDGVDTWDCSDPRFPCRTLSYARQHYPVGTINLAQGRYVENIAISNATTGLTIKGGWDRTFTNRSENPVYTIIDGAYQGSVFDLSAQSIATIDLRLVSLTLTGGSRTPGGGIAISNEKFGEVYLSLQKCALKGNIGGGIAVFSSSGTTMISLDSCQVTDNNTGAYGGGLDAYALDGSLRIDIKNSIIARNIASHKGGGIRIFSSAPEALLFLNSSTITANKAPGGDGVYLWAYGGGNVQVDILNSILWGNGTDLNLIQKDIGMGTALSANAMYSDIGVITDVDGLFNDNGHILRENPLFQNPGAGDFHLSEISPVIDEAICGLVIYDPFQNKIQCIRLAPLMDFEGDRRPSGCFNTCDMGADEYKEEFPWILFYPAITGAGRK